MNGFTDKPTSTIKEDFFRVEQYISGLSDFIRECNTPMTIAIQGDWGSGKTSMMNMIRENLGDKVITSWFNTWQYSQFNMGDALALSFLSRLCGDLDTEAGQASGNIKKVFKTIARIAKTAGVIAADTFVGGKAAETLENGINKATEQEPIDMPQAINDLKEQFKEAVECKTKQAGKDRLVIFIDDLDRLHPGKAVELLEVLKLFLDCDKCVFVLAIDYGVVSQGVKQKYGELIGEEKGKSFFDKIIQVPFKMPVAQYDVENYVTTSLEALGLTVSLQEAKSYVKLIQRSVGCNPRAMKRLFNAFLLLNKISAKGKDIDSTQRKMLFAILCLQLSFENVYNYIVQNIGDDDDGRMLQSLKIPETYKEGGESPYELQMKSEADIANVVDFMTVFLSVLDQNGDEQLNEKEVSAFNDILLFSTITANTASATKKEANIVHDYRIYNRKITKEILDKIQGNLDKPFRLYQSRRDHDQWKKQDAGACQKISTVFGDVWYEFKITTDLNSMQSHLSVNIYPTDKTDRRRFTECVCEWLTLKNRRFIYSEENYRFSVCNKTVPADSRGEIIEHFISVLPSLNTEVEEFLHI